MTPRRVVAGAAALAVVCGIGAASWAAATGAEGKGGAGDHLPPVKAAHLAQERRIDESNRADASDPTARKRIVEEKQADLAQREQQRSRLVDDADAGADDWPVGIFEDSEAPAPGSTFLGTNRWVGLLNGVSVAVFAGRSGSDPSVGRVLILWASSDANGDVSRQLDLVGVGDLRVESGDPGSQQITLVDASGGRHVLDVLNAEWLG